MTRLKSNLLESGSGKIGNIVFYYRNGVPCARSVPKKYHDKKSEAQLKQRQKMKLIHDFLGPFSDLLKLSFKEKNSSRTGYQSAQSYNLKNAIAGEYPNLYINKEIALLSHGTIPMAPGIQYTENDDEYIFTWEATKGNNANPLDTFILMIRDKNNYGEYFITGTKRYKGTFTISKDEISGEIQDIWVAFRNNEETMFSNNYCLTTDIH